MNSHTNNQANAGRLTTHTHPTVTYIPVSEDNMDDVDGPPLDIPERTFGEVSRSVLANWVKNMGTLLFIVNVLLMVLSYACLGANDM